jgi:hypothetical protein
MYENDKQHKQTQLLATNLDIEREREENTKVHPSYPIQLSHSATQTLSTFRPTTLQPILSFFFQPCHLPGFIFLLHSILLYNL